MTGQPMDDGVDRRSFLQRLSALAAASAVGGVALPAVAHATPAPARPVKFGPVRPEALADHTELTIAEAATLIGSGQLKPSDLVEAYLERISRFDPTYQAFNLVLADESRVRARALDGKPTGSPLFGIPLAIKDNYFTAGVLTTANSFLYAKFEPPYDAEVVRRFTTAGGIVLGKSQMGPLATTRATTPNGRITTVNAWAPGNAAVDPGGSSTGSATATAGRMVSGSVGTQTGGSITAPSNAQNLTGLKPTMGRVSLHGIVPLSYTRDHPGPLARDAMDAAILLSVMAGADPNDPRTEGLPPVPDLLTAATPIPKGSGAKVRWPTRIGVIPGYTAGTTPVATARRAFLDTIAGVEGITVVDVSLPDEWDVLTSLAFNNARLPERSEAFRTALHQDLRLFGVSIYSWLFGAVIGADEFLVGQRAKSLLLDRVLNQLFKQCDVVVQTSPNPFDAIGLPELALPIGFDPTGLPIGTILGGKPFGEDRLLAVAAAYQHLTDWHHRRPADPKPTTTRTTMRGRVGPAPLQDRGRITAAEAAVLTQ
ncbi:amidase [Kribbella sp. NPDC020789]